MGAPGLRAEATYQSTIGALLYFIAGKILGIKKHPSFASEAKLIEAIVGQFPRHEGLSQSTLSRKLPEARRALQSR